MPVYRYRCSKCGAKFEKTQKYEDKPLVRCRKCRSKTLRRVYGVTPVIYIGSGWYKKDSKI